MAMQLTDRLTLRLFSTIALTLSMTACNAEQVSTPQAAGASTPEESHVLTAEEAGLLFLRNASNFIDESRTSSNRLFGRTITADFANGNFRVLHEFSSHESTIKWEVLSGPEKGQSDSVPYQARDIRDGITLVLMSPTPEESVVLVVDDNRGLAYGFLGKYEADASDWPITLTQIRGPILEASEPGDASLIKHSEGLVGSRFTVVYPNEVAIYEHIYVTPHYVTWVGHKGTSAGVADTDRYYAVEVAPQVYLVAWNEHSAPIQISFLFDFEKRTESAAFFGFDESSGQTVFQTTAATIVERTSTQSSGNK